MFGKPNDYDSAQAYDSDFSKIQPGGYVCVIKKMEETLSKTGKQMCVVYFDIAEGDYKGYYEAQYRRNKASEMTSGRTANWSGKYNLFPLQNDGTTNPSWKGFLQCVENSNYGFKTVWPLNLELYKGKKVGLLFREEESIWDGRLITSARPCASRTVDCIQNGEFNVPKKRELREDQKRDAGITTTATQPAAGMQEFVPTTVEDDDLPF